MASLFWVWGFGLKVYKLVFGDKCFVFRMWVEALANQDRIQGLGLGVRGLDTRGARKVDAPGKGNSNSHGARPVYLIITMINRIRTSRLPIKNSLSAVLRARRWVALSLP